MIGTYAGAWLAAYLPGIVQLALATSLVIIALKSYSGFWKYLDVLNEQNLELHRSTIGLVTALGIAGSFAGKHLAIRIQQKQLQNIFGVFLIVMGIYILGRSAPAVIALPLFD